MGFKMGIVGLPNVGKSTLFNALTRTAAAQAANFPFCTIEPNTGIVELPDPEPGPGELVVEMRAAGVNYPDLLVVSATGADSVIQHQGELEAQGIRTVVVNYANHSWQELARQLGEASGLQAEAQAAIERFDAYAAQVAAGITPPAGTVSLIGYNLGGSYSVARLSSPHAHVLKALGFDVAGLPTALQGQVKRSSDVDFISRENLSAAITGDTVFLLGGSDSDVQAFLADPVLANLPAVIHQRVYALGPSSFRIDYYSGREMIDTVARVYR